MTKSLLKFDREHIWHPYTSATNPLSTYPVERAEGVRIFLSDGRALIDGMASWWSVIHGYNNPVLNKALTDQAAKMAHVMFGGLTHEPAINIAKILVEISPDGLEHVFFADSGSVSVEVALKMAIQYWQAVGRPKKNRLMTIKGGYHGDTLGAMSVCDPVNGMHSLFTSVLPQHVFAEIPTCRYDEPFDENSFTDFLDKIERHADELAAVILEPIVQGAGGMRFYSPQYLKMVRAACDKNDVLLICDEIATGLGRTGALFASNLAGISPDIMCVGKSLTGGYMTLAATLASSKVAKGISADGGVFMHGPTFMGNPLACAVANASVKLLLESNWKTRIPQIRARMENGFAPCRSMKHVADVRTLGAIGVIEMKNPVEMEKIQHQFVERGIWVRPFGKLVYIMPPYVISDDDLDKLTSVICEVVDLQN